MNLSLSFFLPILVLSSVFAMLHIFPFGNGTFLISDMYGQYIHFFNYYYDIFHGNNSLFYSWQSSMGMNFYGIFGYYLSSPLSLLILFLNREQLPLALFMLVLLKVGFSGLSMNLYVSRVFKFNGPENLAISISYALMSYIIVYYSNIMWLEGLILLPIILIGIEKLVQQNKVTFFILFLALLFICNFYISYMVGIFTFFYFIARMITLFCTFKTMIKKIGLFTFSTIQATGISAIVTLPTYLALKETINPIDSFEFKWSYPILNWSIRLFNGAFKTFQDPILPYMYVGISALFLLMAFFVIKGIPLREKVIFGLLFFFLIFSFEIPFLNLFWHGFHFPIGFPARFSFVFSFLLLYFSTRSLMVIRPKEANWFPVFFILIATLLYFISIRLPNLMGEKITQMNFIFVSIVFLLLYAYSLFPKKKLFIGYIIVLFVCFEMGLNAFYNLKAIQYGVKYDNHTDFQNEIHQFTKSGSSFFRIETNMDLNRNAPLHLDYNGISHFSSMMNGNLFRTLSSLGYTTNINRWVINVGNTLVTDGIFGLKYIFTNKPVEKHGYQLLKNEENFQVFENKYALPLGFMVKNLPAEIDGEKNPFEIQNQLLNDAIGNTEGKQIDFFKKMKPVRIVYSNIIPTQTQKNILLNKKDSNKDGRVVYYFKLNNNKQFYGLIDCDPIEYSQLNINGKEIFNYPQTFNKKIVDLGKYNYDKIFISFKTLTNQIEIKSSYFYALDIPLFEKWIDLMKRQPFIIEKWDSRSIKGHIKATKEGILFLSVPYDKGWTIKVDGQKTAYDKVAGSFIGIHLTKGTHAIQMSYISPGFTTGAIISSISFFLFLVLARKKKI